MKWNASWVTSSISAPLSLHVSSLMIDIFSAYRFSQTGSPDLFFSSAPDSPLNRAPSNDLVKPAGLFLPPASLCGNAHPLQMSDTGEPTGASEAIHPGRNIASSTSDVPDPSLLPYTCSSVSVTQCLRLLLPGLLQGSPSLCPSTHTPHSEGVNLTKPPTYLLFQLSRWLLHGQVAPLSLAHKSPQDLILHISPTCLVTHHGPPQASNTRLPGVLGAFPTSLV